MYFLKKTITLTVFLSALLIGSSSSAEIYSDQNDVRPLLPGMQVPAFDVKTVEGERVHVQPDSLEKPVVVTFYRGGWCPYCNLHLAELRKAETELRAQGFDVWFISADRPERLYESLSEKVDYQLYSDGSLKAAETFGIAFKVSQDTLDRFASRGLTLEEISGDDKAGLPVPATFIIGTDGRVHFQYVNPNYSIRLSPKVLLAAAEAYQLDADKRFKRDR